jgi:hypothetical protein
MPLRAMASRRASVVSLSTARADNACMLIAAVPRAGLTASASAVADTARSSLLTAHWLHVVPGVIAVVAVVVLHATGRRRERGRTSEIVALHDMLVRRGVFAPDDTTDRARDGVLDRSASPMGHRAARRLAAFGLVGAALIHAAVAPEHFAEATSFGLFFSISAIAQLAFAALIVAAPSRPLLQAAVVGSLAIVALWAMTRTVGLPVGPEPGEAESVGSLDLAAGACELLTAVGAALALRRRDSSPAVRLLPGSRVHGN